MTPRKPLPSLLYMSERRLGAPLPEQTIAALPEGAGAVIREYDSAHERERRARMQALAGLCERRGAPYFMAIKFLGDVALFSDSPCFMGFHLPRHRRDCAAALRAAYPRARITASLHTVGEAREIAALPIDAVIISPFFHVSHKDAGAPLGAQGFRRLAAIAQKPAYALGGVTAKNSADAIKAGAIGIAGTRFFWR